MSINCTSSPGLLSQLTRTHSSHLVWNRASWSYAEKCHVHSLQQTISSILKCQCRSVIGPPFRLDPQSTRSSKNGPQVQIYLDPPGDVWTLIVYRRVSGYFSITLQKVNTQNLTTIRKGISGRTRMLVYHLVL